MIIEIDRDSDSIIFIEDDRRSCQSIRKEDTIISVPPSGKNKVTNIYVDPKTGKLIVDYQI